MPERLGNVSSYRFLLRARRTHLSGLQVIHSLHSVVWDCPLTVGFFEFQCCAPGVSGMTLLLNFLSEGTLRLHLRIKAYDSVKRRPSSPMRVVFDTLMLLRIRLRYFRKTRIKKGFNVSWAPTPTNVDMRGTYFDFLKFCAPLKHDFHGHLHKERFLAMKCWFRMYSTREAPYEGMFNADVLHR